MICTSSGLGTRTGAKPQQEPLHRAVALQLPGLPPKTPHAAKPPALMRSFDSRGSAVLLADANALGGISSHNHRLLCKIFVAGLILLRLLSWMKCHKRPYGRLSL